MSNLGGTPYPDLPQLAGQELPPLSAVLTPPTPTPPKMSASLCFFINHIYLYMCAHICTPQGACVCTQMCFHQRKDLLELALSFHHVIPATELSSSGLAAH